MQSYSSTLFQKQNVISIRVVASIERVSKLVLSLYYLPMQHGLPLWVFWTGLNDIYKLYLGKGEEESEVAMDSVFALQFSCCLDV